MFASDTSVWAVFIPATNHVQLRTVKSGRTSGSETQVLSGLKESDEVTQSSTLLEALAGIRVIRALPNMVGTSLGKGPTLGMKPAVPLATDAI